MYIYYSFASFCQELCNALCYLPLYMLPFFYCSVTFTYLYERGARAISSS
jgi:hypothetical protein